MRSPGGSLLEYPHGSAHTLRPALVWARESIAKNLVILFTPTIRGAVAPRHDNETVNTTHAALSRVACHQQGSRAQIVEEMHAVGDFARPADADAMCL
jgi:hypothetical protein